MHSFNSYKQRSPSKDLATLKRSMAEEVRKLKERSKIVANDHSPILKLDRLPVADNVKERANEILNELDEKHE